MSIKGLTDLSAAFPRIGELRKGEKKPETGNRPGKDLTYFRFTSDDSLAIKKFNEAYPDQEALRNINVFLPHRTTDENIDSWIEKWVAGGLVYRSDGETLVLWRNEKGGYSLEPRPDPYRELDANGKRKDGSGQVGRLAVIIPELGRFATVTILTTSKHDIMNLTRQLRSYEALRGDLRGIPFVVKRRMYKISTPGQGGERLRREKWLLSIETQPAWTMAQLGAMERAALPAGDIVEAEEAEFTLPQLPAGISDPFDEPEEEAPPEQPTRKILSPRELKEAIEKKTAKSTLRDRETGEFLPVALHPFGSKTANLVSAKFEEAFRPDPRAGKMYHAALKWLTGQESATQLTAAQADAVLDWLLNGNKELKWKAVVTMPAPEEALAVYQEAVRTEVATQKEAGQQELFGEPVQDEIEF
ncbi:MAG: hypothetical protein BroJett011_62510 [Chloroflexota bacterium]|nr:MAG: hypothetical protein BroJett011_62510 [Chloroflexota bacterium]